MPFISIGRLGLEWKQFLSEWWILVLLLFLLIVGYCYLVVADLIGKAIKKK